MGKEIERKFLLAKGASIPIPAEYSKLSIKQGYISVEKDSQIRVRITKDNAFNFGHICVKYTGKLVRDEFDFNISTQLKDAKDLYKKCKWTLEKKRLSFESHYMPRVHYDVDTFPNGMQWVEVEFLSIKDMKKWEKNIPSWIGKEITGVSKYSNITLAKKKLKFNGKR
jgi:adenylate cyclase